MTAKGFSDGSEIEPWILLMARMNATLA